MKHPSHAVFNSFQHAIRLWLPPALVLHCHIGGLRLSQTLPSCNCLRASPWPLMEAGNENAGTLGATQHRELAAFRRRNKVLFVKPPRNEHTCSSCAAGHVRCTVPHQRLPGGAAAVTAGACGRHVLLFRLLCRQDQRGHAGAAAHAHHLLLCGVLDGAKSAAPKPGLPCQTTLSHSSSSTLNPHNLYSAPTLRCLQRSITHRRGTTSLGCSAKITTCWCHNPQHA